MEPKLPIMGRAGIKPAIIQKACEAVCRKSWERTMAIGTDEAIKAHQSLVLSVMTTLIETRQSLADL